MTLILNLGCGSKTSSAPEIINVDWGAYQRIVKNPMFRRVAPFLAGPTRASRMLQISTNVVAHNLSKGIPFGDDTADVVYHSHLLEHLDRPIAAKFMTEVKRVLRPNGVQRIAVPDLEILVRAYLTSLEDLDDGNHDEFVAAILEQSVRREAYGTSSQRQPRRLIENVVLGDARRRGETHQWMYDFKNLSALLKRAGFQRIVRVAFDSSEIQNWDAYGLDRDESGHELHPGSLYVEATI